MYRAGLLVCGVCLLGILVIGIGSSIVMAQSGFRTIPVDTEGPYTAVSGPVEQGDSGFWRAPYVPTGRYGVSGPVEQGDSGFLYAMRVPVSRYGISGPVEQGDSGF